MTFGARSAWARMAGQEWLGGLSSGNPHCGGSRESPGDSPGLTLTWTGRGQVSGEAFLTIGSPETLGQGESSPVQTPQLRNSCPWVSAHSPWGQVLSH